MSEETAYLDLHEPGIEYAAGELTVHVSANYDEAFPFNLAADVFYEDKTGKRHYANAGLTFHLLNRIKHEQPEVWRRIKEMAEDNYLEGASPEFEYEGHVA